MIWRHKISSLIQLSGMGVLFLGMPRFTEVRKENPTPTQVLENPEETEPFQVREFLAEVDKSMRHIASHYPQLKSWKKANQKDLVGQDGRIRQPFKLEYRQGLKTGFMPDFRPYFAQYYCGVLVQVTTEDSVKQILPSSKRAGSLVAIGLGPYSVLVIVRTENPQAQDLEQKIIQIVRDAASQSQPSSRP